MLLRVASFGVALSVSGLAFGAHSNCACGPTCVFSTPAVVSKSLPILRVRRPDNCILEVLDNVAPVLTPIPLTKKDVLNLDPSLKNVLSLRIGWEAVRQSPLHPWVQHRLADMAAN